MKINPPKAIVDEADPFNDALFGRKDFAASLTTLLKNISDNLVIFINAPWGEGKSAFAQMWITDLKRSNINVIYFDAYASDYFDDPFVCFSGEILELVDKHFEGAIELTERKEFKKSAVEIAKRLAGLTAKVGLRAATMNAVDSSHVQELKGIAEEFSTGISEIGSELIEKKIENYSKEKDALLAFKKSLAKLAVIVRKEQGFPLAIVVDELDRCRPDFALGLLERIKHLFDVEGVVFILLVNREQIESYVRNVYGEIDARGYLLKFGSVFVDLPNKKSSFQNHAEMGKPDFCLGLLAHYGFSERVKNRQVFISCITSLVEHFNLTLREIEKVFTLFGFYYSSLTNELTHEFLISMLTVIKIKKPILYQHLVLGKTSLSEFFKETALDEINRTDENSIQQEWVNSMISFFLMSEKEFNDAIKDKDENANLRGGLVRMTSWLNGYNMNRAKVIPFLCNRLDRFSPPAH